MSDFLKRALFVIYSGIMLGLALPVALAIHVYDFAAHLEERWVLWLAAWDRKATSPTPKGQDSQKDPTP